MPNPDDVIEATCASFGLLRKQVISTRRHKDIALARQVVMFVLSHALKLSTPRIGQVIGREHSTVMHGIASVAHKIQTDGWLRGRVLDVLARLSAGHAVAEVRVGGQVLNATALVAVSSGPGPVRVVAIGDGTGRTRVRVALDGDR